MKHRLITGLAIFALLPLVLLIAGSRGEAAVNIQKYADSGEPYVFGQLTAADTLTSLDRAWLPIKEICYYIKITSRHASGAMSSDTVYVVLAESADDSTFSNVSSTGEVKTFTQEGVWPIHFDYLASTRFTRLEIPRMTDSLTVNVKVIVAPREVR